jgi:hypothetical protein
MRAFVTRALGLLFLAAALLPALPAAAAPARSESLTQYRQWIAEARVMYPYKEPASRMYKVMMCESGGDRFAVGGGRWYGLFQYVPGTWRGAWNPYRASSLNDSRAQIFATAKAWSIGMQSAWSCYYLTR